MAGLFARLTRAQLHSGDIVSDHPGPRKNHDHHLGSSDHRLVEIGSLGINVSNHRGFQDGDQGERRLPASCTQVRTQPSNIHTLVLASSTPRLTNANHCLVLSWRLHH